jgi:hypothetical protein
MDPRFEGHPANPAFLSNLEHLMFELRPARWIHGHLHRRVDLRIGPTRVLANPRGYPRKNTGPGAVEMENAAFDPEFLVSV